MNSLSWVRNDFGYETTSNPILVPVFCYARGMRLTSVVTLFYILFYSEYYLSNFLCTFLSLFSNIPRALNALQSRFNHTLLALFGYYVSIFPALSPHVYRAFITLWTQHSPTFPTLSRHFPRTFLAPPFAGKRKKPKPQHRQKGAFSAEGAITLKGYSGVRYQWI